MFSIIYMNRDIEMLNRGILPDSLNFNNNNACPDFDIYKLAYNLRYKTPEYWASKFPEGHESIPGFNKIFEKLAEESLSPLEEITLIQENNISNNIDASKKS